MNHLATFFRVEITVLGWFLGRIGSGLGMTSIENLVIMALVGLSIVSQWFFLRIYARIINKAMIVLDSSIAEALKANFENLPETLGVNLAEGIEPPNPVQQIIAQFIQQKLNPEIQVKEIQRSSDGKFS